MLTSEPGVKKRNRTSLSCNYCKKRKVKCDRGKPCSSCLKHNVGSSCTYPEPLWVNPIKRANVNPKLNDPKSSSNTPIFHVQRFDSPPQITSASTGFANSPSHDCMSPSYGDLLGSNRSSNFTQQPLQSELDVLKYKIKEIESILNNTKPQSPSDDLSTRSIVNRSPVNPDLNFGYGKTLSHYNLSNPSNGKGNIPIQLPPINCKPQTPETPNLREVSMNLYGNGAFNSRLLEFKVNSNPTFIGINPFYSDQDLIDFYAGYSPIRIKEARRLNYGPLSWLALMKKDTGLSILWEFMMSKRFEKVRNALASGKVAGSKMKNDKEIAFRKKAIERFGVKDLLLYNKQITGKDDSLKKTSADSEDTNKECDTHADKSKEYENLESPADKNDTTDKGDDKLDDKIEDSHGPSIAMNKHAISLGLSVFEGKIDQELHLIERIKSILPKQKVMWILIGRFFKFVYPYMPFVDEESFKMEMNRITGPENYEETAVDLKMEKRLDFAFVGILLIIMRFAYLSLLSNKCYQESRYLDPDNQKPEAKELRYLIANPITISMVDMAKLCLDQFDLFRNSNLTLLQLSIFLRLYNMYAPEDGDGSDGGDSQIVNGMLIQMAYSIGVNREPNKFEDVFDDSKTKNLARKMWHFLKVSDISQAYQYGNPLIISSQFHDARIPYYEKGNGNIIDIEMETNVISTYGYFEKYYYQIHRIINLCLDIQKPANVTELTTYLSEFEVLLNENYGNIDEFLTPFDSKTYGFPFIKALKCRNYMNMKTFLLTLFFQMYLYYEKQNQKEYSYFYLKKAFATTSLEFLPVLFQLIFCTSTNFGSLTDLFLNPSIESLIHKISHINFALLIKINCVVYSMKSKASHETYMRGDVQYKSRFTKLQRISKILEIICRYAIAALSRLSNKYYYSWRITKAHTFFLKLTTVEEFYKFWLQKGVMTNIDFNLEQISELLLICETSYNKISKGKLFSKILEEDFEVVDLSKVDMSDDFRTIINSPKINDDIDVPVVTHSHGTGDSISSIDSSEIQVLENAEVDRLWYQMATMKNDMNTKGAKFDIFNNVNTNSMGGTTVQSEPNPNIHNGNFNQSVEQELNSNNNTSNNTNNGFSMDASSVFSTMTFDNMNSPPMNLDHLPFNPVFDMFENFQVDQLFKNMTGEYL